jgi:Flp pilus assembly protein TadD
VDEAEHEFRGALRSFPHPKTRINLGLVYLRRGQLDDAEREFKSILQSGGLEPAMRATVLNNLGIVSALKGKQEEAEQAFTEVIRLDQNNADARGNLGKLYLEKQRYREGTVQLEEAVRLKRSDANFHRMLGEAYYHQGMKELAAVELAKALSLKTDLPEARALLNKIGRERAGDRGRRG